MSREREAGTQVLGSDRRRLLPGRHLCPREGGAARPRRPGRLRRAPEAPGAPELLRHGDDGLAAEAPVLLPPAAGAPHTARRAGRRAREVGSRGGAADGVAAAEGLEARGADLAGLYIDDADGDARTSSNSCHPGRLASRLLLVRRVRRHVAGAGRPRFAGDGHARHGVSD